jgi:hypothetical protein
LREQWLVNVLIHEFLKIEFPFVEVLVKHFIYSKLRKKLEKTWIWLERFFKTFFQKQKTFLFTFNFPESSNLVIGTKIELLSQKWHFFSQQRKQHRAVFLNFFKATFYS